MTVLSGRHFQFASEEIRSECPRSYDRSSASVVLASLSIISIPCRDYQMAILRSELDLVILPIRLWPTRCIADAVLIAKYRSICE